MTRADLILAIDQGTTSTRAIAYDQALRPLAQASRPLETRHPRPGWVEQDPLAILASVELSTAEVLAAIGGPDRVGCLGLDNQGETVVAWDAETLDPLAPAIVWQCGRSLPIVRRLADAGHGPAVRSLTGLPLDPYFSAGKMTWLLEHEPAVSSAGRDGRLRLGTIDAWLTARLGDQGPLTDASTGSRTQLLGLRSLDWEPDLLELFGVERAWLPRIGPTAGRLGTLMGMPLTALACDQQSALAGHGALRPGDVKATFGTGVFALVNAGDRLEPPSDLELSIAWQLEGERPVTVLQGGVFTAGALVDWLRDGLSVIDAAAETETLARAAGGAGRVRLLPALSGLGAPWYRPDARAVISGLTLATGREHIVGAALDSIAHRTADVVEAAGRELGGVTSAIRVDGGLTANRWLMQRQADLLGVPVDVASVAESTALGIAWLAGIGAGILRPETIAKANPTAVRYVPELGERARVRERTEWREFVEVAAALR